MAQNNTFLQTSQVSRIGRETHAFDAGLTPNIRTHALSLQNLTHNPSLVLCVIQWSRAATCVFIYFHVIQGLILSSEHVGY